MDKGANSREVASHQFVADEDGIDADAAKDAGIVGAKVELAGPQIVGLARCGLSGAGIEQGYEWYSVFGFVVAYLLKFTPWLRAAFTASCMKVHSRVSLAVPRSPP